MNHGVDVDKRATSECVMVIQRPGRRCTVADHKTDQHDELTTRRCADYQNVGPLPVNEFANGSALEMGQWNILETETISILYI